MMTAICAVVALVFFVVGGRMIPKTGLTSPLVDRVHLKAQIEAELSDPEARERAWLMPWAELDFRSFAEALPDSARVRELLGSEKARFDHAEMKSPFPDVLSDGEFWLFTVVWYNADAKKAEFGLLRWPGPTLKDRSTIEFLREAKRWRWRRDDLEAKRAAWSAQWEIINPPFQ